MSGTIEDIPAGTDRTFEIMCYDDTGTMTYYGSRILDVAANTIHTLNIILYPIDGTGTGTGTVIVIGTFSDFPQSGGIIVFQADYSGSYDIYSMTPQGTDITRLTSSPARDYFPQISPDGTQVIFSRREGENRDEGGSARPYLMDINGDNVHALDFLPGAYVAYCGWSPDGSKLVMHAAVDDDTDIFIYDFSTDVVTQIVSNNSTDWIPRWSPTNDEIIFYSNISGLFRIYLVNPDGANLRRLINSNEVEEREPSFSPGGSQIVMMGRIDPNLAGIDLDWGVFSVMSDGTQFSTVINTPSVDEFYPSWSPGGDKILFKRWDGGPTGFGLFTVNPDGSNQQILLDTALNKLNAHWR